MSVIIAIKRIKHKAEVRHGLELFRGIIPVLVGIKRVKDCIPL
jgi:hypothetical protein